MNKLIILIVGILLIISLCGCDTSSQSIKADTFCIERGYEKSEWLNHKDNDWRFKCISYSEVFDLDNLCQVKCVSCCDYNICQESKVEYKCGSDLE